MAPRDEDQDRPRQSSAKDHDRRRSSKYDSRRRRTPDDEYESRRRRRDDRDRDGEHKKSSRSKRSTGSFNVWRPFAQETLLTISPPKRLRRSPSRSASRSPPRRSRGPLPSQQESFRGQDNPPNAVDKPIEKEKPNFSSTGLLAKEANTVAGTNIVLKYHEPPEARKPPSSEQWRMYVFKGKDMLDTVYLHTRSCWLMGRDQAVVDMVLEHPSISKQHAVIQFRHITKTNEYGDRESKVKPYLIDLESANGTRLNGEKVGASRYIELVDSDVIGFGDSEREYVMMLPPA
ncbi:hypothetical protein H2203_005491 [Taxawa tesnikishii (nom. ined.)]|nr:hypothetical protein H2203_005491 [Dothideales sp. JES 119]